MSTVITQINCNFIPIYIIKKTNIKTIYYCILDNNETAVIFFNNNVNIELFNIYFSRICIYKSGLYSHEKLIKHNKFMKNNNYKYLLILGEYYWNLDVKKPKGLYEIFFHILFDFNSNQVKYLIIKLLIISFHNENILLENPNTILEKSVILGNYGIINTLLNTNFLFDKFLLRYIDILNDYGIYIKSLSILKKEKDVRI